MLCAVLVSSASSETSGRSNPDNTKYAIEVPSPADHVAMARYIMHQAGDLTSLLQTTKLNRESIPQLDVGE